MLIVWSFHAFYIEYYAIFAYYHDHNMMIMLTFLLIIMPSMRAIVVMLYFLQGPSYYAHDGIPMIMHLVGFLLLCL